MARYRELIVKGDDRDLVPYLAGFLAANGVAGVYFAEESGLHVHALRERIRHHGEVQHVVCTEEAAATVRDALAKAIPRYLFEIKEEREIGGAAFRFQIETPSRDVAQLVRDTLAGVPVGTALSGFQPREEIDSSSTGPELYSPFHGYVFHAKGELKGDVDGVIKMRRRLCTIEFVECDEVDLFDR